MRRSRSRLGRLTGCGCCSAGGKRRRVLLGLSAMKRYVVVYRVHGTPRTWWLGVN
jgi:hypothetical protein